MTDKGRNYRTWTTIEENILVEALVNMANSGGYKADNGFKSGYLQHLEHEIKKNHSLMRVFWVNPILNQELKQ